MTSAATKMPDNTFTMSPALILIQRMALSTCNDNVDIHIRAILLNLRAYISVLVVFGKVAHIVHAICNAPTIRRIYRILFCRSSVGKMATARAFHLCDFSVQPFPVCFDSKTST